MGTFTGLIVLGAGVALVPRLPLIQVLVGVYVLNGLLLPIELFAMLRLINDREIMGPHVNGRLYNLLAWSIALLVSLSGIDPLRLTILSMALTVIVLPIVVFPFLVLLNDEAYLGPHTNGRLGNAVIVLIVAAGFLMALVVVPLQIFGGQ